MDRKDYVEILKALDNISFNTAVIKWILLIPIILNLILLILLFSGVLGQILFGNVIQ